MNFDVTLCHLMIAGARDAARHGNLKRSLSEFALAEIATRSLNENRGSMCDRITKALIEFTQSAHSGGDEALTSRAEMYARLTESLRRDDSPNMLVAHPAFQACVERVLFAGLHRARIALDRGDTAAAYAELDHVHNLPALMRPFFQPSLDFYLNNEVPLFLHRISQLKGSEERSNALREFSSNWDRMREPPA